MRGALLFRGAAVCDCKAHGFVGLTLGFTAMIDPEDVSVANAGKWNAKARHRSGVYAERSLTGGGHVSLHRCLMGVPTGDKAVVDHINGDTLDNRKANLRICGPKENSRNQKQRKSKSRFKGVYQHGRKWASDVVAGELRERSYGHETEESAARAYDAAALRLHGPFAKTNQMMGLLA